MFQAEKATPVPCTPKLATRTQMMSVILLLLSPHFPIPGVDTRGKLREVSYMGWGMVTRQVEWQSPYSLVTSELLWLSMQKDKTKNQPCCDPESFLCVGGIVVSIAAFQKAVFECCLLPPTHPTILSPVSSLLHYLTSSWPPPTPHPGRNFSLPALQSQTLASSVRSPPGALRSWSLEPAGGPSTFHGILEVNSERVSMCLGMRTCMWVCL